MTSDTGVQPDYVANRGEREAEAHSAVAASASQLAQSLVTAARTLQLQQYLVAQLYQVVRFRRK